MTRKVFWELGLKTIQELENEKGIFASAKEELYGCIFGRDSLITALKLIRTYSKGGDRYFLILVDKILSNLVQLQGQHENIESGEQPGKCIHEFRVSGHLHLTGEVFGHKPWYVYPDGTMRSYDSVDSTPLFLIALYRYWQQLSDPDEIQKFQRVFLPAAKQALDWLIVYGDSNKDAFIDYRLDPNRLHGGLVAQSWMDSAESVFHEDSNAIVFPVAPVEVQGYAYLALRLWAKYFESTAAASVLTAKLSEHARNLKRLFNEKFVLNDRGTISFACGIDGSGKAMTSFRSSAGHLLWAGLNYEDDAELDSILEKKYIPDLVKALMSEKIFEPKAGIRTLAKDSRYFKANSYHNGSIWPHDNSIIAEGFRNFGYSWSARKISNATLRAVGHFNTAIELFSYENDDYIEYCSPNGQTACRKQAWSAAALLKETVRPQRLLFAAPKLIRSTVYSNANRFSSGFLGKIFDRIKASSWF